jgi:hypothetical protein
MRPFRPHDKGKKKKDSDDSDSDDYMMMGRPLGGRHMVRHDVFDEDHQMMGFRPQAHSGSKHRLPERGFSDRMGGFRGLGMLDGAFEGVKAKPKKPTPVEELVPFFDIDFTANN